MMEFVAVLLYGGGIGLSSTYEKGALEQTISVLPANSRYRCDDDKW